MIDGQLNVNETFIDGQLNVNEATVITRIKDKTLLLVEDFMSDANDFICSWFFEFYFNYTEDFCIIWSSDSMNFFSTFQVDEGL